MQPRSKQVDQFWCIDAMALFYQSFHAPFVNLSVRCSDCNGEGGGTQFDETGDDFWEDCPTCEGTTNEPTKATYLFLREILRTIRTNNPKYLAVVFDGKNSCAKRLAIDKNYKANRGEVADGVIPQLRRIKQLLKLLSIETLALENEEADDVIATLATQYASPQLEVNIISRDKDFFQLCTNDNIFVYDSVKQAWNAKATAGAKFGVSTNQLLDFFCLLGDSVDNIEGVKGWGKGNAAKWLTRCGSIGGILDGAYNLSAKLRENLQAAVESGSLAKTRKLLKLDTAVEVGKLSDFVCPVVNLEPIRPLLKILEIEEGGL